MHCDDRALHELGIQLHSQRMEHYRANQSYDTSQSEKSWLRNELEMRNRAFQEDRVKFYQEIEELRRICCTEAERARQLRIDELCRQERESKSTVDQLVVQIQELQDRVISLNDAREFHEPETVSSSGLLLVPSQPVSIPSQRGLTSRDSCLQLATPNSCRTSGNVFEHPSARSE